MPLDASKIGQLMQRYTQRIGDPTGTLVITHPQSITGNAAGNPFARLKSPETFVYTFPGLRGDWQRAGTGPDAELGGSVDFRTGEAVFDHAQYEMSHDTLKATLYKEGAVATWNGVRVHLDSILYVSWQGVTVLQFTRQEVT